MKKSIFLFFAAILCATSAWAHNLPANQYVYFEKPADWSNVSLLLGHNSYSKGYNMTKITNTNLYYWKTDKWDGYTRYCFIDATGWGGEDKKPDDRKGYASHSTNVFTNQLIKYHLFTSSGSKSSHATDRKIAINRTQTIKVQLKDGSNWIDATVVPADLTASTYAMTDDNSTAVSAASASLAKESTTVSATVSAAYSAQVTLTCTNILDGYMFEGWYDANGDKITSYIVSDAHTVYARFIQSAEETNEVSVTYMCDATEVSPAIAEIVGVETEKSFTAPTVTGYNFTGWTIGAGIDLKAGTVSDATITVVSKSASSDYTLVANYEEVIETVYFINAGNWADVHIHLWNGTATGTEWPGTQLTATGTKIGEYDVYEYTAQQGAHANLLFHKKDNDSQKTTDLTWSDGVDKYYIYNYNGNTGWYTKAEAEELLVVPVVEETVYFVNNKEWTKVQAYAWNSDSKNAAWPGVTLTATGEKVAGFDVYSYTAPQGYVNVIFNNKTGNTGVQSADFVWTNGKYYCMGADANYAGGTQENVETIIAEYALATEVYLAGEMTNKDNWDVNKKEFRKATADATNASVTVTLEAQTYKFKLVVGGAWKGNDGTMKRGGIAVHEGGWSFDEDKDCQIVADIAGDYTFTWDLNTKKLTVAYPPLPKYTVTATAENGTVTGAGEYEQGSEATLVATPNTGYAFQNWTKGSEEVSTEATYTFTVTADVELVANFVPEETHEVTVSYLCNATPIPSQTTQTLAVGVTTPSTITAPSITNYTFKGWTLGTGIQTEDDATDNPIHITAKAEGEYTLTANYTKIELTYNVTVPPGTEKCYICGGFDNWDKFHEMELKEGETNIFTLTIDGATTVHKYKYACQASWDYVEKDKDGNDLADDRTWTELDKVEKWAKPDTYTIAGTPAAVFGTEWDANSVANIMRKQHDGTFVWSAKGLVLTTTTEVKFKVVKNQDWNTAWPSNDKVVTISADGIYNLTIYFNAGEKDDESKNNGIYVNLEAATPDYTRDVDPQYYGTICLPKAGKFFGGSLYEVAYYDETAKKVYFDEVLNGEMEAGMPYIFLANATMIEAYYTNDEGAEAKNKNGLYGTLVDITSGMNADGVYMIYRNQIIHSTHSGSYLNANRAYIKLADVPGYNDPSYVAPAPAPGRKRIAMGTTGQNTATGVDQVQGDNVPTKTIINGQLFILRGEKMYDAQGKLVK